MINEYTVAERLYSAYCLATGGKAYDGKPLPTWEEFCADPSRKLQSDAWVQVARTAMDLLVN